MAPMKRPAAACPGSPSKRIALPGTGESVSKQCNRIREAMNMSKDFSPSLMTMLTCNLGASIGVAKEERHAFQARVAEMIGEVLNGVDAALKAAIQDEEAKVAAAEAEQTSKAEAQQAGAQTATEKGEATVAAKAAMVEAGNALSEAIQAASTASAEQISGDAEYDDQSAKKTRLESALNTTYQPLKNGTADPATVAASTELLVQLGKEYNFDPSLLSSLPSALGKAPDARGSFDNMCMEQAETELGKHIASLDEALSRGAAGKAERAAKLEAAKSDVEAKTQADQSSKDALKEAQAAQKEAEAAAKDAAKAAKEHQPEVRRATNGLAAARENLREFQEGALADYSALKNGKIIDGHVYDEAILAKVAGFAASGGQVSYVEAKRLWSDAVEDGIVTRLEKATLGYAMREYAFTEKAANFMSTYLNAGKHTSYYEIIDGKKFDRSLLEDARKAAADGQVSLKEAKKLFDDANTDGNCGAFTGTERSTLEHALKTLTWTDAARTYMVAQLKREKPVSYYKFIDGKKYDQALLMEIQDYASQNESVSEAEAERLWAAVNDGPGVTATEKNTLKYGLNNFTFTEAAKAFLEAKL